MISFTYSILLQVPQIVQTKHWLWHVGVLAQGCNFFIILQSYVMRHLLFEIIIFLCESIYNTRLTVVHNEVWDLTWLL